MWITVGRKQQLWKTCSEWTSPRCEWGHCDADRCALYLRSGWCCASLHCQKMFRSQSAESRKEGPPLTLHCCLTVHLMAFRTWVSTKEPHPSLFKNWGMVHLDSRIFHNRYENNLAWFTQVKHHWWRIDDFARILGIFYICSRMMKVLNCKWFQFQISYDIDNLYPAAYRRINSWQGDLDLVSLCLFCDILLHYPIYYMDTWYIKNGHKILIWVIIFC